MAGAVLVAHDFLRLICRKNLCFLTLLIKCFMYIDKFISVKRRLVYLLVPVLLSGCGFQLRGAHQLPQAMQSTYIDTPASQKNSELIRVLKRRLKANNINLLGKASADAVTLKLGKEQRTRRAVAVDSRGKAREYTLTYSISFSLSSVSADLEMPEQSIRVERDFLFDTQDVLGNSREEAQLYNEMQQDAARLILLRLQSVAVK